MAGISINDRGFNKYCDCVCEVCRKRREVLHDEWLALPPDQRGDNLAATRLNERAFDIRFHNIGFTVCKGYLLSVATEIFQYFAEHHEPDESAK